MVSKKFILFLLSIFVATIIIVVTLQYTANSNINRLIEGNQELLAEFKIKSEIQELVVDLTFISTETKKVINQDMRHGRDIIDKRIKKVTDKLVYLNTIPVSPDTRLKLNQL